MENNNKGSFKVGDWRVKPDLDCIVRGPETVNLRPQVMELLVYLAERPGEVVSAEALLGDLWPDKVVTGASVYNSIAELRQALAGSGDGSIYVQTIPKKGYRLIAPVSGLTSVAPEPGQDTRPNAGRRATIWIAVGLVSALVMLAFIALQWNEDRPATQSATDVGALSIAVMPFVDLSPESDQAYFCDGITEELVNGLAHFGELRVVSHSSSRSLRVSGLSSSELADRLNVTHLLEGSVRKAGDRVRITAQLIDARADAHLWAQTFDRTLADVFAIQDEISARVMEELKVHLLAPARNVQATEPHVFELYLEGRYLVMTRDRDDLRKAQALFERAIAIDPEYAPAHAGLAKSLMLQIDSADADTAALRTRAEAALDRALQLDPRNADALATKGLILGRTNLDLARQLYEQAIESNPSNSDARRWLALSFSDSDPLRYLDAMRAAYLVDPLLSPLNYHRVVALHRLGRQDEALEATREWHELYPGYAGPFALEATIQERSGNLSAAIRGFFAAYRVAPDEELAGDLPWLLWELNEADLARAWAIQAGNDTQSLAVLLPVVIADSHGQRDETLRWLTDIDESHPDWWPSIGTAYGLLGEFERARGAWERGLPESKTGLIDNVFVNWGIPRVTHYALALQRSGAEARAKELIDDALALAENQVAAGMEYYGEWTGVYASVRFHAAALYAMRGDTRRSLDSLAGDMANGGASCPSCLLLWPQFDSLRENPEFMDLVAEQIATNSARHEQLRSEGLLLTPEQVLALDDLEYELFADRHQLD